MKENNNNDLFEKIEINLKDSAKRSLTEIHNGPINLEENKIDEENPIKNNNRAYSLNIYTEDPITKEDLDEIRDFKAYCLQINFRYDANIFNDLLLLRFLKSALI